MELIAKIEYLALFYFLFYTVQCISMQDYEDDFEDEEDEAPVAKGKVRKS